MSGQNDDLIFGDFEGNAETSNQAEQQQTAPSPLEDESAPSWHSIPPDLKLEIFSHLSVREACKAARVCRDFALLAATLRAEITTLHLPASSIEALLQTGNADLVRDVVIAHPAARTVTLSR